jgi:hypothetical protein
MAEGMHMRACVVQHSKFCARNVVMGQKQTFTHLGPMPALPPKADIAEQHWDVCFVAKSGHHARDVFRMKSLTAVGLFTAWRKQEPSELHRQEVYRPQICCCPTVPSMGMALCCPM